MTASEIKPEYGEGRSRILALLWHAPHSVITAGGFRRTFEIFERAPENVEVLAVDDEPSFLNDLKTGGVEVLEYRIPWPVRALEAEHFWLERVLEWIASTILMVWACIRLAIRRERFDVIFVPSSEQVPALLAGIFARYLLRAPLVACNLNIDIFPGPVRRPLTRLHNLADCVIVISEHLESELRAYGLSSPIELNGVGLDTAPIDAVSDPGEKTYDGVFVGRHDIEKGVFDLVEIWSRVVREHPSAKLAMIGSSNPTNRAKLVSLISRLGLRDSVELLGTVGDEEKYEVMKLAKVCVFPSYVEEWGIVPQEALACGLPVVAYDLPVYRENIVPCEAVFRLPVGDVEGIARKTSELLREDAYRRYSAVGPDFVRRFEWDEVASREFSIMLRAKKGAGPCA
jgi:glycosyltransferase involved in cell wall biosynthesis